MHDNSPDRLFFDTAALPERDRFPAFCEGMFRNIIGADIVRLGSMPFRGTLEIRRAGAVGIANIATTSADIIRNASHTSDGDDAIVVQLWQQGLAMATQGKHENQIKTCEGLIIDNAKAAKLCLKEPSRFWVLTIPRGRIASLSPDARLAGAKLSDDLPLRLLFGYLDGTLAQRLGDHRAAQLFGDHLVDLVALALGARGDHAEMARERGVKAARLSAIRSDVLAELGRPDLSAEVIAARYGISPRYVGKLFEQDGTSFKAYVLAKRLAKAHGMLIDRRYAYLSITQIAYESGFGDISYFNRTFRRIHGATPSDIREAARLGREG